MYENAIMYINCKNKGQRRLEKVLKIKNKKIMDIIWHEKEYPIIE